MEKSVESMASYIFAAIILILFLIGAWATWHYGHKYGYRTGWTRKGINKLTAFMVILAIVFSTYIFIVDYKMRITTLYEDFLAGSMGAREGAPSPIRKITFEVEHPGIEHRLLISPASDFRHPARSPVRVLIRLTEKNNRIIDVAERFQVRKTGWDSKTYRFTPVWSGPYELIITPVTIGIPKVHVRITDPAKRDGKRPRGY